MKKIAITGSTGLVGSCIVELLKDHFIFIPLRSAEFDITNHEQVQNKLNEIDFDVFLHLAAYTQVDKAETEKDIAYAINVTGTKNVLEATLEKKAEFIYVSTGFVFDGQHPPYFEESEPNPIGYYGKTKYEGEQIVEKKGMIVRFEYPYGNSPALKKDFARIIKGLLEQGKTITAIENSQMTPTHIDDIAESLKYLINNYSPEIFHTVGANALSPFECAKTIAETFNIEPSLVQPTTYEKYFEGKAKRPQWADVKSKKNTFLKMKSFAEGVKHLK